MRSERARLSRGDLLFDALRTIRSKPGRALALGLAIIGGVACFIGILSMSASANRRTAERIQELRPELVRVTPNGGAPDDLAPGRSVTAGQLDSVPQVRAVGVADTYEASAVRPERVPNLSMPRWWAPKETCSARPVPPSRGSRFRVVTCFQERTWP